MAGIVWADQAQDLQARKQQAIIDALRAAPPQPEGKMVGGQYIRPHWTQALSAAIGQVMGAKAAANSVDAEEAIRRNTQGQYEDWVKNRPQARQEAVDLPFLADPSQGDTNIGSRTVQPTTDDKLNWAMKGMNNPLSKSLASAYATDLLVKEPERDEARAFRADEADKARQAAKEAQIQKAADALDQLKLRLEDKGLDRESREKMNAQALALQRQLAEMRDATQREIAEGRNATQRDIADARFNAAKDKPPKPLPAAQSQAWINNNVNIKNVDRVMGMIADAKGNILDAAKKHLGSKYMVPGMEWVGQGTDPEGVPMRSAISDIGSLKIHDRSGAAVTAAESPRLRPFIPTIYDKPEAVRDKLTNFRKQYEMMQQEIEDYADTQGYKSPRKPGLDRSLGRLTMPDGTTVEQVE